MSSKSAQAVKDLENRFFIQRKVYQALVRSRLYGGGTLVIGVDQGHPEEELDLDKVGQGDLKFVIAVSGWLQGWTLRSSAASPYAVESGEGSSFVAVSGDRPRKAANILTFRT